ncbi:cubilin-like [Haliotis cracherodii]|uniref:cubilin-like n=1 Tax=Haliotis cracherodii TaxID=6455 RepID=UPI0039EBD738
MAVILGRGGALKTAEMRLTAHLLVLFINAGLCSTYGQRDFNVDHIERHIDVSAYNNHTWGSDAALRFTSGYEDGHIVLTITTESQHTGNCSDKNAIITIKEATDATGQFLCGDGVYESRGRVVTAVITGSQDVRISYILRPALYQCNTTFQASQATSILRSADIFRQNSSSLFKGTCRWTIYSRPGYNVRVQLLESNITSPCSENKISVDIDDQVTLSWCGNESSSYTSYHSELVIRFNMSSIADGHGFTINYTEVQDLSPGFISNCRCSFPAAYLPRTLTFNLNVSSDQVSREYKEGERQCYLRLTTYDSHVLVTVLQSSLPSTCSNDTVQVVEGPYLRTSWCEHSTPPVQSMGTFLTIKFNASSVTSGSVTIQYRTVTTSWNTTRPCYLKYNSPIKNFWSWYSCLSYLPPTSLMQNFTVTNDDFFTVYPYFPRMTREWRIQTASRYVYTEIETYPDLRCSHGAIQVYDCGAALGFYRYLGSWCDGRANYTFSSRSCMAVLFNATHLYGGSNAIFSLKYKYVEQLPSGTTTRPSTTTPPSMTIPPAHPACSEVTRSVTSGVHSQVLVIPALARVTCRWKVTTSVLADSENQIELNLESWSSDITISDMCYGRYLEVFDGPSSLSPFLARWCGQSNQRLVSTGQVMFLVYTGGFNYPWLPWSVHYKTIVGDSVLDVASQRSSRSNKTGVIVGSVFGVVVLVLAVVGTLIAWRMYSRKKMSPYQNQIIRHSEAGSSAFTVMPPSFSNAVYGEVKSPEIGKEAVKAPCNVYDTPNTNEQPECHRNQYLSLYQPLDPGFPKGNVEDKLAIYDNHVRGGKGDN